MIDPLPPRAARRGAAAVLAVVLAVVVAACGSGAGGDEAGGGPEPPRSDTTGGGDGPSCPEPDGDLARFGSTVVEVVDPGGARTPICVLVADRNELRQRGLMEVTDLAGFDGMVFAYATDSDGGYWMRDTPMPLTIAWIDASGEVVDTADMEPCLDPDAGCPTYDPDGRYRWALEVPRGGLVDVGLVEGAVLDPATLPAGVD